MTNAELKKLFPEFDDLSIRDLKKIHAAGFTSGDQVFEFLKGGGDLVDDHGFSKALDGRVKKELREALTGVDEQDDPPPADDEQQAPSDDGLADPDEDAADSPDQGDLDDAPVTNAETNAPSDAADAEKESAKPGPGHPAARRETEPPPADALPSSGLPPANENSGGPAVGVEAKPADAKPVCPRCDSSQIHPAREFEPVEGKDIHGKNATLQTHRCLACGQLFPVATEVKPAA